MLKLIKMGQVIAGATQGVAMHVPDTKSEKNEDKIVKINS